MLANLPQLTRAAYSVNEIAGPIVPISARTLQRVIYSGELPSIKLRGRRLVRREDLEKYLASLTGGEVQTPSDE